MNNQNEFEESKKIINKILNLNKKEIENNESNNTIKIRCNLCGKIFKTEYKKGTEKDTIFYYCDDCREFLKNELVDEKIKSNMAVETVKINYTPFEAQKKVHEGFEQHRFTVLAAGNRFGKDYCSNVIFVDYFFRCVSENRHIDMPELTPSVYGWIIAPVEKMALQNFKEVLKIIPKEWIVKYSESKLLIETIGGGIIEVKSAYDPESLVGVGLDIVEITEGARIRNLDVVWGNIEARLSSPNRGLQKDRAGKTNIGCGKAIINSSPLGKNYFYKLWTRGQKKHLNYSSNWISFQFPWTANPTHKKLAESLVDTNLGKITYEQDLIRQMGERKYKENYLADFLAGEGYVFQQFYDNCVIALPNDITPIEKKMLIDEWKTPIKGHQYRIGYDPATGGSGDTPALIIRDLNTNKVSKIISLYGKTYERQWDDISFYSKIYNNADCAYGVTGHTAIRGQLQKRNVNEIPLDEHGGRKAEYINGLERAIQNMECKVLLDDNPITLILIDQMTDYIIKNGKYSNDIMEHDDFVSAMYFAFYDFGIENIMKIPYINKYGVIEYDN